MSNRKKTPGYYVGIGASAGGLEAIEAFVKSVPPDSGLAFVVVQHLSPDYRSMMAELLSKHTTMPVLRAEEGMRVEADHVYLIPPKMNLSISDGKLQLSDQDRIRGVVNHPIDVFLKSLAEDQGELGIAIILSGTGTDGTRGVRAIKDAGGMVMVQDETSAKFDGMPRSAIATGVADFVLAPADMPAQLLTFIKHPYAPKKEVPKALLSDEDNMSTVFSLLRETSKVDFTHYKPSTIARRIGRRMSVRQFDELSTYVRYLEANPSELSVLYQELLIGVTNFFRDPEVWDYFRDEVIGKLLLTKKGSELRLWCAACSTGEEAYTMAILCREAMELLGKAVDVKIFATDIDREAVATAGNGVYPASIAADVPANLLAKYFHARDDTYAVTRSIREMVVFARHNLLDNPPFTNIDLISCRNMLIYLLPVLQKKALGMFSFSLNQGGYLLLGSSEALGDSADDYEVVEQRVKLFSSKVRRHPVRDDGVSPVTGMVRRVHQSLSQRGSGGNVIADEIMLDRLLQGLVGKHLPVVAVVNESLELVHLVGDSSRYLRLPSGRASSEIVRLAHKDLSLPLATGLQKVFKSREELVYSNVHVRDEGHSQLVNLHMMRLPAKRGQQVLAAVLIEPVAEREGAQVDLATRYDLAQATEQRIQDLEQELQFTRENLQATVEELETSNEELQATNEELLASNEELQSTNEELQSVNEELHTVNAELITKNTELTNLGGDLENLLVSSDAAILLLDENLQVRRFTPSVTRIFAIVAGDLGRPLDLVKHNLMLTDLPGKLTEVMQTGRRSEQDVNDNNGNTYIMRLAPYQVAASPGGGIVLTLTNINERIQAEAVLRENEERFRLMVDAIHGYAIHLLDAKGYVMSWNAAAERATGFRREEIVGRQFTAFFSAEEVESGTPARLLELARRDGKVEQEAWRVRKDGSRYWANEVINSLLDEGGRLRGFVRIARDLSSQHDADQRLQWVSMAVQQSPQCLAIVRGDAALVYSNAAFQRVWGMASDATGTPALAESLLQRVDAPQLAGLLAALASAQSWRGQLRLASAPGGALLSLSVTLAPLTSPSALVQHFVLTHDDGDALPLDAQVDAPRAPQVSGSVKPAETLPGLDVLAGQRVWKTAAEHLSYLRQFMRDNDGVVTQLAGLPQADALALAHQLRGASANLALTGVATALGVLEVVLEKGNDPAKALARVQTAFDTAQASISRYAADAGETAGDGHADAGNPP